MISLSGTNRYLQLAKVARKLSAEPIRGFPEISSLVSPYGRTSLHKVSPMDWGGSFSRSTCCVDLPLCRDLTLEPLVFTDAHSDSNEECVNSIPIQAGLGRKSGKEEKGPVMKQVSSSLASCSFILGTAPSRRRCHNGLFGAGVS